MRLYWLARQWDGSDPQDPANRTGLYFQTGFGTNYGVCSFITPFFRMSQPGEETTLTNVKKGALNGENNGLSLLIGKDPHR